MNKRQIVELVAGEAGTTNQAAEGALGTVFESIAAALARGEDVTVAGLGRFVRTERPLTGAIPCG